MDTTRVMDRLFSENEFIWWLQDHLDIIFFIVVAMFLIMTFKDALAILKEFRNED